MKSSTQWWIQDFPEEGAPIREVGANILFNYFFLKTARNKDILDRGGQASHGRLSYERNCGTHTDNAK